MFDPYDSPLLLPPASGSYEPEPEADRIDYALNGICRFTGLFALGITVTLLARWLPALLPFYWIGTIACLLALVLPAYLSQSARLLAIAIALIVAVFSGWFDAIAHTSQQVQQQVQEVLK
ncbi:hypothetical protein H6F76_02325 [Leptolyngbya sp. FACHB-321]|uniref:hypothetical protein n=1 Tax=Leptolyngbya sp. FACHB-321 TaxID=2692807 RepID=UPI001684F04E|nr:hypothetical protein [Leptolyngbya sp. FACHB-321]MBD2033889.1 hypothetical protein [Leptolyngbya sp. FACHB-321]